ncbi:MAG: CPBP family intramembrane metalloprotease [Phocaeicola sp.]|nr:CPBP family intramembrane metalloprotease [Phocaeicola sp.]
MGRSIKLVLYYFVYQVAFTFLVGIPASVVKVMNEMPTSEDLAYAIGKNTASMTGVAMVLAGIAMTWHLIHFNYVKFNKASWTEVPARTILLSIPFIMAAMFVFNIASELAKLPNLMEDTFMGMSRNLFGILSIAIMAPLVEELLFRGAIEGHLLKSGKSPRNAILLSSLIFGIIHINPAQVPFAFCIGLVFGWLYYRTGSVVPGMIGHFLNNAIATVIMGTSTHEEMNRTTAELIGAAPTYTLLALALIVFIGMYGYLNKQLPVSPYSRS